MAKESDSQDSGLLRDEQYQRLLALKDRVKQLESVISEGERAEDFIGKHPFYPVFERTLLALRESYNSDAHKAAKDARAEIANFLGREEAVKDIFGVLKEFSVKADAAEEEKKNIQEEIKELTEILATPETNAMDNGGVMG